MNIFKISHCFITPITTVFHLRYSKLLSHQFKNEHFLLLWGMKTHNLCYCKTVFVICFSENLMLFFVILLIFVGIFFSIPLPVAYDTMSDHLCVCMSVQVKVRVKARNNPLEHTLHTEGFLFLYSLLSHYFTSSLLSSK